jgi:ketosteroid isomerase-like protein
MTDEQQIRQVIGKWMDATRMGRKDDVLSNHAADAVIFDPLPPLRYESAAAYRKSFDLWWPETTGEGLFELHDLKVTAGDDVAFAHALLRCGGTRPDGETFEDTVRVTICLRKTDGKWLITHQHTSVPIEVSGDRS